MPLLRSSRRLRSNFGELPADYADESPGEEIPQVDVDEMVDLANELMRNGNGTRAGIRVRPRNIELARDIILEHERRAANGTPRRLDDRPLWMKVVDSVTITLFPIIFIRIVKNLLTCAGEQLAADEVWRDSDGGVSWAEQQRDHCAHARGVLRLHDSVFDVHGDLVCVSDPVSDVVAGEKVAEHREAGDGDNHERRGVYIEEIIR
ncbi:hypothetical protein KL921_003351 [Ogataea angusta]|nr:hypothetical protein KL921_003351 [Ogataea angusta]KAG7822637.1 hypothetical protein KL909_003802 [Ogataea angusta]